MLTSLSVFGICLTLTVALLIVLCITTGGSFLMFYLWFSLGLAGTITGESGMFNPNGGPTLKPLTYVLCMVIALLTVPLLAGLLYGLYWSARAGISLLTPAAPAVQPRAWPPHVEHLLLITNLLRFLAALLLALLGWNMWRNLGRILSMSGANILSGYVVPLLRHGLAFVILPATQYYLLHYSDPNAYPGPVATVAAVAYVNLWIYTQARLLLHGPREISAQYQPSVLENRFFRIMSVPHGLLFGYLLAHVFLGA